MKKLVFILSVTAFLASCSGNASKDDQTKESTSAIALKDTTVVDTTATTELAPDSTVVQDSIVAVVQETDTIVEQL